MEAVYWAEALRVSAYGESEVRGGCQMFLYHQFYFPSFSGFSLCWWSRGQIYDFSMNMGNWSQRRQHIGNKN